MKISHGEIVLNSAFCIYTIKNARIFIRAFFCVSFDEVKYLCKIATAGSKEAKALLKAKKIFDDVYREGETSAVEGVKYSLNILHTDGSIETISDARNLTQEQALQYLEQAKSGTLKRNSYIPVRKDTPRIIIDTLKRINVNVENLSLIMQVRKAQQSMASENPGAKTLKHGSNVRKHALTPDEIVNIINKLDTPNYIVYQTNRRDKNGNELPNNIAVFVEYRNNGNEALAVVEFDSDIDKEFINDEFGDTKYHTVVTLFEPDTMRNGMPFDYLEELLSNPDNYDLEIVRKHPIRSATGEKHPNTSNELLSNSIISNSDTNVNRKNSLSPITPDVAPGGTLKITSDDVMLKAPEVEAKTVTKNTLADETVKQKTVRKYLTVLLVLIS